MLKVPVFKTITNPSDFVVQNLKHYPYLFNQNEEVLYNFKALKHDNK